MLNGDRRTIFKRLVALFFWVAFALLFFPFYSELLLAGVFAFAIEPLVGKLLQGRRMRWRLSVALILTAMFVGLAVPVTAVAYKAYVYVIEISRLGLQNTPLFQKLVLIRSGLVTFANNFLIRWGLEDRVDLAGISEDSLGRAANFGLQLLTQLVYQIPSILLSLFVFCAALYFFLAEATPLKRIFLRQHVLNAKETEHFIQILQKSSYNTVVSSMLIAILQSSMVALGSLILHTGDFMTVWVITFFCSFVPVIGAGPVALALGLGQLVLGEYGLALGFVVVAIVAGTVDNLVRPYLISSGDDDLHPVVSLLAIIGALVLFGMPGLFLGPVIAGVAVKIIPVLFNEHPPAITANGKDRA